MTRLPSTRPSLRHALGGAALAALALSAGLPAAAQTSEVITTAPPAQPDSPMIALIQALIDEGNLSPERGALLIAQARAELAVRPAAAAPVADAPGTVRVARIPEPVRQQIRDEIRAEVIQQAKTEGWATPNAIPEWTQRVTVFGDLRARYEGRFFAEDNALGFVNVDAINRGDPYDTGAGNPDLPPILNSSQDRADLTRLRARLGVRAEISPGLSGTLRLATSESNSPVSTNQTLGGYLSKTDIVLDQAYIRYQPAEGAWAGLTADVGRAPNPLVTTELVWDDDVSLDGVSLRYDQTDAQGWSTLFSAGFFPIDYVDDAFPQLSLEQIDDDEDKWLYTAQVGAGYAPQGGDLSFDAALGYYHFDNIEGQLSPACSNIASFCLTDFSRPGFLQKGNTLFALRNLTQPDPTDPRAPQYFGLASEFQIVDLNARLQWRLSNDMALSAKGAYVRNIAYDAGDILDRGAGRIINNNETCDGPLEADGTCANPLFDSGGDAWLLGVGLGRPEIARFGDWRVGVSYRYIEPDAVLDAFNDSDFRLGGTNAEGYVVSGSYGLTPGASIDVRWLSGKEVSGPPFAVDVLQTDLNVKF